MRHPQHREHQGLHILRLDARLGQELSRSQPQLVAFALAQVLSGVDHQRKLFHLLLLTQPIDQSKPVSVGQSNIQNQQVRRRRNAQLHRFALRGGVMNLNARPLESSQDDLSQIGIILYQ